jgi:hypothetical protein
MDPSDHRLRRDVIALRNVAFGQLSSIRPYPRATAFVYFRTCKHSQPDRRDWGPHAYSVKHKQIRLRLRQPICLAAMPAADSRSTGFTLSLQVASSSTT